MPSRSFYTTHLRIFDFPYCSRRRSSSSIQPDSLIIKRILFLLYLSCKEHFFFVDIVCRKNKFFLNIIGRRCCNPLYYTCGHVQNNYHPLLPFSGGFVVHVDESIFILASRLFAPQKATRVKRTTYQLFEIRYLYADELYPLPADGRSFYLFFFKGRSSDGLPQPNEEFDDRLIERQWNEESVLLFGGCGYSIHQTRKLLQLLNYTAS